MRADRRISGRTLFAGGYLLAARIRPGRPVIIVNLSSSGALVEGPWRFRPLSRCDMHLQLAGRDVQLRARIMRCFVARLDRQDPVRYRTALAFDQIVELPARWDALEGYSIPPELTEPAAGGVADSPSLRTAPPTSTSPAENRPVSRID